MEGISGLFVFDVSYADIKSFLASSFSEEMCVQHTVAHMLDSAQLNQGIQPVAGFYFTGDVEQFNVLNIVWNKYVKYVIYVQLVSQLKVTQTAFNKSKSKPH